MSDKVIISFTEPDLIDVMSILMDTFVSKRCICSERLVHVIDRQVNHDDIQNLEIDEEKYKLCYIEGNWAYFTTCDIEKQWGDDWNDAPYEHNAGSPYYWDTYRKMPRYEIKKLAFESDMEQPYEHFMNSPYSVQDINAGVVPWLKSFNDKTRIFAGTDLKTFKRTIRENGGSIFVEEK